MRNPQSSGPGNRGRGSAGGQRGVRGGRGYRGRGRGRGQGRGRGTRGGSRSGKPSRYQEYDCSALASISEKMNSEKAFYLVNRKSIYTDVDVASYRGECLRSMIGVNQTNQLTESTIKPPTDLAIKQSELVQKGITEKGFSNSWLLSGTFFNNVSFHGWVITFNPTIPMHDRSERKIQLFGGIGRSNWETRRRKLEYLENMFGHIAFDNQIIWTTENKVPADILDESSQFTIARDQFGTNYDMSFVYQGVTSMGKAPLQEAERLLHLSFLRPVLILAGFVKDGPQERKWIPKQGHPLYKVTTVNQFKQELALDVIVGYKINVHLKKIETGNGEEQVFPVLRISSQSRLDLRDDCLVMLKRGFEKCNRNVKIFRSKAEEQDRFKGRSAYTLYGGRRNIKINEIDWSSNEKTLVTGKDISVSEYLKVTYGDEIPEVYASPCTFKRFVGSDEYFLPQFLKMTAKSSDAPLNYGKALELTSKSPAERFMEMKKVCSNIKETINTDEKFRGRVVIAELPVMVEMIHLSNPIFTVQSKTGNDMRRFSPTDLPGAWGRNAGGPIRNETIASGSPVPLKQWKIVNFQGQRSNLEVLLKHVEAYRGMRKMDGTGLLGNPWRVEVKKMGVMKTEKQYQDTVSKGDQLLLVILPSKVASQVKTYFTKAVQYTNHPNPPQLQFILAKNCFNKNAALAAIANSLAKLGNVIYHLAEPYRNAYGPLSNSWVIGLDVTHSGKRKPSIACMALITAPLSGTSKFWRPSCVANKPGQEVLCGRMADGLMRCLLEDVYLQELVPMAKEQNKTVINLLPPSLIIIRDGLADDQIYESINEELLGIDSAIAKFARSKKINWKPKIVALVSPKASQDDICRVKLTGDNQYELSRPGMPTKPVVVIPSAMMHRSWFDFFILGNPKDSKAKPRRYVLVRDDLGVTKKMMNFNCLCNYILAMMWGYCMAVPFSTGCSSQPSCVKVAKHYAELLAQIILSSVKDFGRFSVNRKNRPQIAIKEPLRSVISEQVSE